MEDIIISRERYDEIYSASDEITRSVLERLVGEKVTPTLDDYRTIRSYEDACVALGISAIFNNNLELVDRDGDDNLYGVPNRLKARLKLQHICKALWGGRIDIHYEATDNRGYYFPVFRMYDYMQVKLMSDEDRHSLLQTDEYGPYAFGCRGYDYVTKDVMLGSNDLVLDDPEKALYFGQQFVELWAEYYGIGVGARLT